jgi:uncharacterized membrane-anchored protein
LSSEHPQMGDVRVPGTDSTLHLGKKFYYLSADEAKRVLTEAWGNPPDAVGDELGMVFPAGKNFVSSEWGAIVKFDSEGYVESVEAKPADFERVARAIRDGEDRANEARKKEGVVPIHFVGWAQAPSYDPATHTAIWARDLHFGSDKQDTLNYDIRTLGRRGSLIFSIVAPVSDLPSIRPIANELLSDAAFDIGSRYEDFNAQTDKKAAYGVAGMVAAGAGVVLAQKVGLFAVLALLAKKAMVLVVAAFAAVVGGIKKLLSPKKKVARQGIISSELIKPPKDDGFDQPK